MMVAAAMVAAAARESVAAEEAMEVAAEEDQAEGGEAAEALDAREAVAAAEVEVMEVVVEPEVMETVAAAEAMKVMAPEEIMDICNLNPVNLCPAGFQRPSKIEGDRTLRSTMALVNLPNELDKLYRAPFASFPSFKYRSKKSTAAEKHLTGDDRGQAAAPRAESPPSAVHWAPRLAVLLSLPGKLEDSSPVQLLHRFWLGTDRCW